MTTYGYEPAGQRQWRLDAKGQLTTYTYDNNGRRTGIQYSDGSRGTYAYDAVGNRARMEDATGITTYTYDEKNRLKTVTYPGSKTITYAYDAVDNRATLADPDGGITTYSYDSRNLLSWLVNPFDERTTWVYDALGRAITMTHANLTIAEHEYDDAGRRTAVRNLKSGGSAISIFTYTYDDVNNRTQVEEANGDVVTWSHDEVHQLTRERRSGANSYDVTYTYDAVGNRLAEVDSGAVTTYSYNAANELESTEDGSGATTYTYDANGNTVGELRPDGDRVTYTWDIENRQTKVELPAGVVNTVTLDGDGKRRSIEDSDGLRNLIWDLENILAETDTGNSTVAQYTLARQVCGNLISQHRSGATVFHHFDVLGSTSTLTDTNAATLVEYLYRAFGLQTVLSGTSPNRFTWVGRLGYYREFGRDDYWVRARILSAKAGIWLGRDPVRDDANRYRYGAGNPVAMADPTGLKECRDLRCGVDISKPLRKAIGRIRRAFLSASTGAQLKACYSLVTPPWMWNSWDIDELKAGGVMNPAAGCPTGEPCAGTVEVDGECFPAPHVNYLLYGVAMCLCGYPWLIMDSLVRDYASLSHWSVSYGQGAAAWATAGYDGWPKLADAPSESRPACKSCGYKTEEWFEVKWGGLQI